MANEAKVFAEGPENCIARTVTVALGTAIPKGTLLVENGTRTGIAHTAASKHAPLGYTTSSKDDTTDTTTIGVQTTGVVKAYADGFIETGNLVISGQTTANRVQALPNGFMSVYSTAQLVIGRALENISSGTAGRIALILG